MTGLGEQSRSEALERLAAQLPSLGAESRAERNAKRYLPWVISIAIHLGVAMIAVFITWTVANLPDKDESVLIVADFNAMQYDPVALHAETDSALSTSASEALDFASPAPAADQLLQQLREAESDSISLLTDVGHSGGAPSVLAGMAPQADLAAARFAGTSATNARKIVYLIDATGSMIAHLQIVLDELARSLSELSSQQSYSVIFFQGDAAIEVPPAGRLIAASPAEHDRVLKWIQANVVPKDRTNPLPAIQRALKIKPDVIFLLSHGLTGHGEFEIDQRDLMQLLDAHNPVDHVTGRRTTQINCIQFIAEDPLDTMKLIAEQHGGPNGYKFLSRRELGLSD